MRIGKLVLALLLAVLLVRLEHTGTRIDQLEPVETVWIHTKEGSVYIETDTGAKGIGNNLEKAVENLRSSTASKVFLDTARYLLIETTGEEWIGWLSGILRPNTLVCRFRGEGELSEITRYLKNHQPNTNLLEWMVRKQEVPTLYYQEGRGQLVQ